MEYKYGYDKKHKRHFFHISVTSGMVILENFFVANTKEGVIKKLSSWNTKYKINLNLNRMEF
jgi:hypothetical protein